MREFLPTCRKRCSSALSRIVEWDEGIHSTLYGRFPLLMSAGGWLLRVFYEFAVSPAFAVILSLLLVGLVLSGVVPIIVSISVIAAWLIATLSIAKNEYVNRLRILERVIVVFGLAALMAVAANRYVKWCLTNYAKNQPSATTVSTDGDRLAYNRFKELLEAEVPKFVPVPPTAVKSAGPSKADLVLDFAGVDQLLLMLRCTTPVPAEKPKHWFGMIDATHMFTWPDKPDVVQPLPLQAQTWDSDYVRQDTPTGPYDVLSESPSEVAKQHVKRGDILTGMIGVSCINCITARRYYVYFKVGSGGWYYQEPQGKTPQILFGQMKGIPAEELEEFLAKEVPPSLRVPIKPSFR